LLPVLKTFAVLKDCGNMPSSKAELKYSDNIRAKTSPLSRKNKEEAKS